MPPLVLFDVDLTLIHTAGAGRKALATAFKRLWGVDDALHDVAIEGRTDHAIFMEAIALNSLAGGDLHQSFNRLVDAYVAELPAAIESKGGGRILPGVVELLDALESQGIAFGLATGNVRRGAAAKLGHFGLWARFPAGGFGEASPVRADVVRTAIAEMSAHANVDFDPATVLVIGDTPLDIEAAHLAGARALGVGTGSHSVDRLLAASADYGLPDLSDLRQVLALITGISQPPGSL